MDGMFNIFGYGMQRPDERDKTEKSGFLKSDDKYELFFFLILSKDFSYPILFFRLRIL